MTTLIFNRSKRNGKASQRTNANKRKDQKPRLRSTWASRAGAGRPLQGSRGLALQGLAGGACPSAYAFQHRRPRKRFEIDLVSDEDFIPLAILFCFTPLFILSFVHQVLSSASVFTQPLLKRLSP